MTRETRGRSGTAGLRIKRARRPDTLRNPESFASVYDVLGWTRRPCRRTNAFRDLSEKVVPPRNRISRKSLAPVLDAQNKPCTSFTSARTNAFTRNVTSATRMWLPSFGQLWSVEKNGATVGAVVRLRSIFDMRALADLSFPCVHLAARNAPVCSADPFGESSVTHPDALAS